MVAKKLHQFQDHFAVLSINSNFNFAVLILIKDDAFYWVIVRAKCEGEWNSVIFFLFVKFVVLTVGRFVERGDGPFELQKQDSRVSRKTGTSVSYTHLTLPTS